MSKLVGEHLVRATCPRHLVVRTCGLYGVWGSGGKGGNFVETMLRLAGQGKELRVVADQQCTPSYTVDVATATVALLGSGARACFTSPTAGPARGSSSPAPFSSAGVRAKLEPTTTREYGAAARRPAYSVLSTAAYQGLSLPPLRKWQDALTAYLAERRERPRS